MRKKSILTMVVSLMLVGAVAVGSTLAYLTSTKTANNSLTVGKVVTQLDEYGKDGSSWVDGPVLIPGLTVDKKPVVTVNKDSEACYVYAKVTMPTALYNLAYPSNPENAVVTINGLDNNANWEKLGGVTTAGTTTSQIYRYYAGTGADKTYIVAKDTGKDTKLNEIFTGITVDGEKAITEGANKNFTDAKYDITVSSFAIQADGLGKTQAEIDAALTAQLAKVAW